MAACKGDTKTVLSGKTFEYNNQQTGIFRLISIYTFKTNGGVYWNSTIGTSTPISTDKLYYKMSGNSFTIFHKDSNKEFEKGTYINNTIIIDEQVYSIK